MRRVRAPLSPNVRMTSDKAEIEAIRAALFSVADAEYRAFQCPLMPTVDSATVIGVRTPILRRLAKDVAGTKTAEVLMRDLPHGYFEEAQIHAFLIESIQDFDGAVAALDGFLPYVDNWATCDQMSPKVFRGRFDELKPHIARWMGAEENYAVRFGIGMLMRYGLGAADIRESLETVATPTVLGRDGYYVRMMVAWFFATALAADFEVTLPYISERRLPDWTHNKAIQKACESYRVSGEQKDILRGLRN